MKHEYKIVESYRNGSFAKCFALLKKDNSCVDGWKTECKGNKDFCESALQKRLDRIKRGLEPTLYEQRKAENRKTAAVSTDEFEALPF